MKITSFTLFLILVCTNAFSQNQLHRIDSLITVKLSDNELSGNVLVAEKGKIIYQKSAGLANTQTRTLVTSATAFQLASVSKPFTSLAILQLYEKGKLRLNDPVKKYIPELHNNSITISQLLSHTSGLADLQILEKPAREDTSKVFTIYDIPSAINNDKNAFRSAPGEKWSYSNSGYNLLALIVEKISGIHFQDYLSRHIFKPAGMPHTYVSTPLIKVHDPNRAAGYDYFSFAPWIWQRTDSLPYHKVELLKLGGLIGMSGIVSTTEDLLHFDKALYAGKIIKKATLELAFTPVRLNSGELAVMGWKNNTAYYGLGWNILRDTSMGKVVFHTGGMPGVVTAFIRNLSKNQTVILLNNVTHRSTHGTAMSLMYLLNGGQAQAEKKSVANEFARTLIKKSTNEAWARFNTIKTDTAGFQLDEREMNIAGIGMYFNGYKTAAMEVLRLNTVLFPNSANVYDSLGMALADAGDKNNAILMYRKALALNPKSISAINALKNLGGE